MPKLTQKDILNNILRRAFDQEVQQKAKYAFLAGTVKDKRLIKIFKVFEHTAQSHIAELQQEMYNLDIK